MVDEQLRGRIAAAVADAESRTSGEILCVLETDRHIYWEWVLGLSALAAFALPFLATLAGFGPGELLDWLVGGWLPPHAAWADTAIVEVYAAVQLLLFLALAFILSKTALAQRLAPLSLRRARVHELALKQFLARGLHLTEGRTGVLIFVSLGDHVAEIVADEGIHARVSAETWGEADALLLARLKADDIAGGFEAAIARVGAVLAEHFPPSPHNPDELPNRLIVL
jgi:putative membrane protein